jgi:hypothetical protein
MEPELKQKIEKYVTDSYTVEQPKIRAEFEEKMAALPRLGKGNSAYSVYADERHVHLYIEMVNSWARAMGNIRMKAYEIYGAPLDHAIVTEVKNVRDCGVGAVSGSVDFQMKLEVMRRVRDQGQSDAIAVGFRRRLTTGTQYVDREISCLIEERKAMPKQGHSVGAINMNAPGQRVVFGDDHSNNSLTISERTFFSQVGDIIRTEVPSESQSEVLGRLAAAEAALDKPNFGECWREFRAAAADYWGFILPALPLIKDYLQRHGIV